MNPSQRRCHTRWAVDTRTLHHHSEYPRHVDRGIVCAVATWETDFKQPLRHPRGGSARAASPCAGTRHASLRLRRMMIKNNQQGSASSTTSILPVSCLWHLSAPPYPPTPTPQIPRSARRWRRNIQPQPASNTRRRSRLDHSSMMSAASREVSGQPEPLRAPAVDFVHRHPRADGGTYLQQCANFPRGPKLNKSGLKPSRRWGTKRPPRLDVTRQRALVDGQTMLPEKAKWNNGNKNV